MIIRLSPEVITPLWDQLKPMVVEALRKTKTHDAEDVRRSLVGMKSQMFAQMNEQQVEAFIVCEFAHYPKGIWLHIWLTAAIPSVEFDVISFLDTAEQWAKIHRCRGLQMINAREGWKKKFPKDSFEGIVIRLNREDYDYGE